MVKHSPLPNLPGFLIRTVKRLNFQAPGAKAVEKRPREGGKGRPLFLGLTLGTLFLFCASSVSIFKLRVQEFTTSLSEDDQH
jgi:hypothetical protein